MKKTLLAIAAIVMFAACGNNSNNSANEGDSLTYDEVKQKIDSADMATQNAAGTDISYEEWEDGGEIVWDN